MKHLLEQLDRVLESRIRLAVMSALMVNESLDFNALKNLLEVSDGNLASHIATLEKHHYVLVKKEFKGKKPLTRYTATSRGRKAFAQHLDALEELIQKSE